MHHPGDVSELAVDPRVSGIARIEDETLAAAKPVGEEPTVRWHLMFRVVRAVLATRHRHCIHKSTVAIGRGPHIEHREEIGLRRVL
jgi:hypothetical protein